MCGTADEAAWLSTPAAVAARVSMEVGASGDVAVESLTGRPGVVVFEDEHGRAILIATTADARGLVKRKLGLEVKSEEGGARGPVVNYRAVTRRVEVIEAASALEADAIYLHEARVRMPGTHRVVSERWRPWFVHVDAAAEHPQWSKTNLGAGAAGGTVHARSAGKGIDAGRTGWLIGPIRDKDTAGRVIEKVIDAFDLCRYHHLLVMSPRATACAYKEMGRCAAPCDGSEAIEAYRARVRSAAEFLIGGEASSAAVERVEREMGEAAARMDFEKAARLKRQAEAMAGLRAGAMAGLSRLDAWREAIVLPRAKKWSARVLVMACGNLGVAGDVEDVREAGAMREAALRADEAAREHPALGPSDAQMDAIAVVSRWMHAARTRRRGEAVRVREGESAEALGERLAAAAAGLWKGRAKPEVVEEREVEVVSGSRDELSR